MEYKLIDNTTLYGYLEIKGGNTYASVFELCFNINFHTTLKVQ